MYNYQNEKQRLFTEQGQVMFLKVRDNVNVLLKKSGSVRLLEAISVVTGDMWQQMACVDRMIELKELRELTDNTVMGQHRVFVKSGA